MLFLEKSIYVKSTFLAILCFLISLNSFAQKRKKFSYSYAIGDEISEREKYTLFDTIVISVSPIDNDSILISFDLPADDYGIVRFQEKSILLSPNNQSFKVSNEYLGQNFRIDLGSIYFAEFQLKTENLNSAQNVLIEKSTILNDPDSGGIVIHSKRELSNSEIETMVWCYIRKEENCYNTEECQISIVL